MLSIWNMIFWFDITGCCFSSYRHYHNCTFVSCSCNSQVRLNVGGGFSLSCITIFGVYDGDSGHDDCRRRELLSPLDVHLFFLVMYVQLILLEWLFLFVMDFNRRGCCSILLMTFEWLISFKMVTVMNFHFFRCDSAVLSGVTLMLFACIVWLKLVSFVHTNYDMRTGTISVDKVGRKFSFGSSQSFWTNN